MGDEHLLVVLYGQLEPLQGLELPRLPWLPFGVVVQEHLLEKDDRAKRGTRLNKETHLLLFKTVSYRNLLEVQNGTE